MIGRALLESNSIGNDGSVDAKVKGIPKGIPYFQRINTLIFARVILADMFFDLPKKLFF